MNILKSFDLLIAGSYDLIIFSKELYLCTPEIVNIDFQWEPQPNRIISK